VDKSILVTELYINVILYWTAIN